MVRKCKSCEFDLQEKWNYCPKCGEKVPKISNIFNTGLEDIVDNILTDIQSLFGNIITKENIPRVEVRIQKPRIIPMQQVKKPSVKKKPERPIPSEVIEPDVVIKHEKDRMIVELSVAGVKSMEDIDIEEFTESIEVRAYFEDKMYFKVLSIPQNLAISNTKYEKDILKIELEK